MIWCILSLIVVLIVDYFVAKQFADIAEQKGHDGQPYFWHTFLLGIVGMLMVIALPNETQTNKILEKLNKVFLENKENNNAQTPQTTYNNHSDRISNKCVCGNRFYGETCPSCGRPAAARSVASANDNSPKANQCECGEMFHGLICPVCGKKANSSTGNYINTENKTKTKSNMHKYVERIVAIAPQNNE